MSVGPGFSPLHGPGGTTGAFPQPGAGQQQGAITAPTQQQQTPTQAPPSLVQALAQPAYMGAPATVNPAYANASPLDPNLINSLSPNSTIQQILAGFAPQANSAQKNLMQTLADFGIGGGQAVQAQTQLQDSLASALAPTLANAIQFSQGNQLQAGEFGSGQGLQAALANAGFANNAGQYNAQATNAVNAANTGAFDQNQQMLLQMILQDYMANLQANAGILSGGQGAANQQAVNYGGTITTSDPFGQIMSALAAGAGAAAKSGG